MRPPRRMHRCTAPQPCIGAQLRRTPSGRPARRRRALCSGGPVHGSTTPPQLVTTATPEPRPAARCRHVTTRPPGHPARPGSTARRHRAAHARHALRRRPEHGQQVGARSAVAAGPPVLEAADDLRRPAHRRGPARRRPHHARPRGAGVVRPAAPPPPTRRRGRPPRRPRHAAAGDPPRGVAGSAAARRGRRPTSSRPGRSSSAPSRPRSTPPTSGSTRGWGGSTSRRLLATPPGGCRPGSAASCRCALPSRRTRAGGCRRCGWALRRTRPACSCHRTRLLRPPGDRPSTRDGRRGNKDRRRSPGRRSAPACQTPWSTARW